MYVGLYICAGRLQTNYRPMVLCYRRSQHAHDNRGKITVPGYSIPINMDLNDQASFIRKKVREILHWYTGYCWDGDFPLIQLLDVSTDGHSHRNYLVVLPERSELMGVTMIGCSS